MTQFDLVKKSLNKDLVQRTAASILFKTVLASKEILTIDDKVQIYQHVVNYCPKELQPSHTIQLHTADQVDDDVLTQRLKELRMDDSVAEVKQETDYVRNQQQRSRQSWFDHELTSIHEALAELEDKPLYPLTEIQETFINDAIQVFVRRERNRAAARFVQTGAMSYQEQALHLRDMYDTLTAA